jgi:hypothetical protein
MAFNEHHPVRQPGAPPGEHRDDIATSRGKPQNPKEEHAVNLVRDVGGKVPNYNQYGHQHHRLPFKNKEAYCGINPLPEWNKKVEFRTRSEMMAARKADQIPDMSYDLDGDGVVDSKDFFYAKLFDKDHNGRLNNDEREKAIKALKDNYQDRFQFRAGASLIGQFESQGARRPYPTMQKRGKIVTVDSWDELGETYPPHSISHIVPKHKSQTELSMDRLGDLKNSAYKLKVKHDERYPYYVPEQPAHQDNWVENPVISSIGQRARADNEAARVRAGLYPAPTFVNPEKEQKQPGLEWVDTPVFQTRSQVLETRKELMKRDLDEQRMRGEETYVPMTVRRAQQEEQEYQFRKGHASNMTKTRLEDYRKKERIEYDMSHFGIRHRELPRYSDQPHPWWTLAQQNKHRSAPSLLKDAKPEEPAYKVTQTRPDLKIDPKPEREPAATLVVAASPELEQQEPGIKTVKRWTTDIIEHNQLRNQPRMFDSLRPARTYAKDFAPMENFSSFEWTRNQALRQQAEARKRNAAAAPKSKLYPMQFTQDANAQSQVSYDQMSSHSQTGKSRISRPRSATSFSKGNRTDPTMPARIASRSRSDLANTRLTQSASVPSLGVSHANAYSVRTGGFHRVEGTQRQPVRG